MRRRAIIIIATWVALAPVALRQGVRADDVAPPSSSPSDADVVAYAGPLKRSPSAAYLPAGSGAPVRSGPSSSASVISTLPATTKPLQSLGMAVQEDEEPTQGGRESQALARTWIKLRLASGASGFVRLGDLVTPQQAGARAASMKKVGLFEAEVAAAKRTTGAEIPSGVYTQGGSCDVPMSVEADVGAFLQSKVLIWQEGAKLHFVRVLRPDDPTVYDAQNDHQVQELRGFGYVPMRTFRSLKDAALMGYKDRKLWVSGYGQSFNSFDACDPALTDATLSMLRSYAGQRPPEAR